METFLSNRLLFCNHRFHRLHRFSCANLRYLVLFPAVLIVIWWMGSGATAVSAAPARNVTLAVFTAAQQENSVQLTWSTATELDTIGFRIEREVDGTVTALDWIGPNADGFIPAEGSPTLGANYLVVDETAVSSQTITYHLLEQTMNGNSTALSSTSVQITTPSTAAPVTFPPTTPPRNTNTAVPTNTPPTQPTNTPTNQPPNTPTTQPTNTPTTQSPTTTIQLARVNTQATAEPEPVPPSSAQTESTAYPAPPTPLPPGSPTPYPATTPVPTALPPTPYPAGTLNGQPRETVTAVPIIGDRAPEGLETISDQSAETESVDAGTGRVFLWGGFLIGLLIFVTAVIGAIMLFTRRQG